MKVFLFDQGQTLLSYNENISSNEVTLEIIRAFYDNFKDDFIVENPGHKGIIPTFEEFSKKALNFKKDFKKQKNTGYVAMEEPIVGQFIKVMRANNWFTEHNMSEEKEAKWFEDTAKSIYALLENNYQYQETNLRIHDYAVETIKELKARGYIIGILANTNFRQRNIQMLEMAGILEYFDELLFSDESGFRKPNVEVLEPTLQKYTEQGIKRYEIAMVGNMIDRDIAVGRK